MISKPKQQLVVGIVAFVWLALALLSGQSISPTPLKLFSVGGTAVTIVLLAIDRFLWRWRLVRRVTGMPLLAGSWRGLVLSSFQPSPGTSLAPIPAALVIRQSGSHLAVTLFTADSSSLSKNASLTRLDDGRWVLAWIYDNQPRQGVRAASGRHVGVAELYVGGQNGDRLSGSYFTERATAGELHFDSWCKELMGDADAAFRSKGFEKPHPFVR